MSRFIKVIDSKQTELVLLKQGATIAISIEEKNQYMQLFRATSQNIAQLRDFFNEFIEANNE